MLPCHKLQRVVLTPTGHPLLKVKRLTLEKLAGYPLITYDYSFIGRSKTLGAFEAKGIRPHIALNAIDADVIKTYVEFGLGIAIVPDMAYDRTRDRHLRAIDARHLFEPNTIHVGIRRNHYLRGYMFAFIEMFAPHLKRSAVEAAITRMATRSARFGDTADLEQALGQVGERRGLIDRLEGHDGLEMADGCLGVSAVQRETPHRPVRRSVERVERDQPLERRLQPLGIGHALFLEERHQLTRRSDVVEIDGQDALQLTDGPGAVLPFEGDGQHLLMQIGRAHV